jgi:hypothetical protein
MTDNETIFLAVREWVKQEPSRASLITKAMTIGLEDYAKKARDERVEWETIAAIAINARLYNGQERILADKIESMKEGNAHRWDDIVTKLRGKYETKASKGNNQ